MQNPEKKDRSAWSDIPTPEMVNREEFSCVQELAEKTGLSEEMVRQYVLLPEVRGIKLAGNWLARESAIVRAHKHSESNARPRKRSRLRRFGSSVREALVG